ncbi:MAG TPA: heme-binding protein [Gammaproteobacteria bacterium]|nr:heme-binding protein [Gammaproteobacteria bacterium]
MIQQQCVSLEDARRLIVAGEQKARDIGQPMNIAVVDNGGNLVAFAHMDGAWKGSVDIAINKAFTSAMFELPTKGLSEKAQSGGPFFGIHVSNRGRVMIFDGGLPLKQNGEMVGAVGVSGGDNKQDQTVAEAAQAAL